MPYDVLFSCGTTLATVFRLAIVAPVETVKTKVIELNKPFVEGFKYIIRTEGFGGVYQGVSDTTHAFLSWRPDPP